MDRFIFRQFFQAGIIFLVAGFHCPGSGLFAQDSKKPAEKVSSQQNSSEETTNPRPLALSPASVHVVLNVNPHHANSAMVEQWSVEFKQRLRNAFGQTINLKLDIAQKNFQAAVHSPEVSISPKMLGELSNTRMELYLTNEGNEWIIQSRSWLAMTNLWTEIPPQRLKNPRAIPRYLVNTVASQLQPIIQIEGVEPGSITGLLLGGEFSTPDDSARLLKPGDVLGVVMLYFNRNRKLQARQFLPWTYLEVTERNRAQVSCKTISAFRSPIPRTRRRVEVMAYRINTPYPITDANVMIRDNPNRPFQLTKVFLSPWKRPKVSTNPNQSASEKSSQEQPGGKPSVPRIELTTTRMGTLQLSREQIEKKLGPGLIKIEVMSSKSVVARVPWLPGSTSELQLTVPDDSARTEARLRLEQLKTELLRVAAKRATLIAALKQLADDAREIDPSLLFKEVEKLPSRAYFRKKITLIRVAATENLNQKGNRTAARDVRKLCEQAETIIEKHLNEEPVEELKLRLGYKEEKPEPKAETPSEK